jgi:hypothetical protein
MIRARLTRYGIGQPVGSSYTKPAIVGGAAKSIRSKYENMRQEKDKVRIHVIKLTTYDKVDTRSSSLPLPCPAVVPLQ